MIPKNDGTFTKTLHAGGPTWNENGKYSIKISYAENLKKYIDYEKLLEVHNQAVYNQILHCLVQLKKNPNH
ncbi:MAG: hypothetical protein OEM28_04080 [Nitrosopumilus sp.]|nr:hypothetical protein [Nitrosopumilus sp.]MDH3487630.1 hypothetical protein [Nitrosopumilus sp.]